MLAGLFALVAAGGLFWLAYRRPRPRRWLIPRRPSIPVRATASSTRSTTSRYEAPLTHPTGDDHREVLVLSLAARGVREGVVDLAAQIRAGLLGDLAVVSETAPAGPDPWVTAAMIEAERVSRRTATWARLLPAEIRPLLDRQMDRLTDSTERRHVWLAGADRRLMSYFPTATIREQTAILRTLHDLRADASDLFPDLPARRSPWWEEAVAALTWAKNPGVAPRLAAQADRLLAGARPATAAVVLTSLRGGRCRASENVLVKASTHADVAVRRSAVASLAWADPYDTAAVVSTLQAGRTDPDPSVRRAAVAAFARFGELTALREFAAGLLVDAPRARHAAILSAAAEGVTWLWPDLDLAAEVGDPDTALAAAEALERMREAALGLTG
jgi:hypothetical protein